MKVRASKNFWQKDSVREKMILRKKDELFDCPHKEDGDARELFLMLQNHSCEVADESFIASEKYIGVNNHVEERPDGTKLKIVPNEPVILSMTEGSRLMSDGVVKPAKSDSWRPSFLLTGTILKEPARVMFDREPEPKNWARDFKARRWDE